MTRRELLRLATALPFAGEKGSGLKEEKRILSAPLTHSDWVLQEGVAWGDAGVRHMLEACKACGWSRMYWRALDSGRALYRSRLRDSMGAPEPDNFFQPVRPEDAKWT